MKVTICEIEDFWKGQRDLVKHAKESDLVLLPELPAYNWFAKHPRFDKKIWTDALNAHDEFINLLSDLDSAVISTRPIQLDDRRLNQAFLYDKAYNPFRSKHYLPNEKGFYEAIWFNRGDRDFKIFEWDDIKIGVLICSEVFFNEWARHYGRSGADIIAVPRATQTVRRWLIALKMAALVSGFYVISSNRFGEDLNFSGRSFVISPDGDLLASTNSKRPFVTIKLDLSYAKRAKKTYPRNIPE